MNKKLNRGSSKFAESKKTFHPRTKKCIITYRVREEKKNEIKSVGFFENLVGS